MRIPEYDMVSLTPRGRMEEPFPTRMGQAVE